jgi:putative protease
MAEPKPIGEVTHYYSGLGVAIVKFKRVVKVGERLHFRGATTDFEQEVKSMQYNHQDISAAKKGQEVGVKVKEKVREGDLVYAAEE